MCQKPLSAGSDEFLWPTNCGGSLPAVPGIAWSPNDARARASVLVPAARARSRAVLPLFGLVSGGPLLAADAKTLYDPGRLDSAVSDSLEM